MNNKVAIVSILLLLPFITIVSLYAYIDYLSPSGWKDAKIGMTEADLAHIIPDLKYLNEEARSSMQTFSSKHATWRISFHYDASGKVERIERIWLSSSYRWLKLKSNR